MDDWIWALVGVAVTLSVTVAVILWHAFKHLDDKIERLGDKLDRKFDQMMAGIAETKLLVAGHAERIEAQEKQTDRLSSAVFAPQRFGAPGQQRDVEQAAEMPAPAEAAAPAEGIATSASDPEPPPAAAIAPA